MSPSEIFILAVRWIHTIAAVTWVGGSLFYLFVIRPASRKGGENASNSQAIATEFRGLVDTSVMVLIITGVVLAFDRLTSKYTGVSYVSVLSIKVALSLCMFWLAGALRQRRRPRASAPSQAKDSLPLPLTGRTLRVFSTANLVAIVGILVFLLSDLLRTLFEDALKAV